jgi:hypothetical protein
MTIIITKTKRKKFPTMKASGTIADMFRHKLAIVLIFIGLSFGWQSVDSQGMGNSNIILGFRGDMLWINPAYCHNLGWSYGQQTLDTQHRDYTVYEAQYWTVGNLATGKLHMQDLVGHDWQVALTGLGMELPNSGKVGVTYESVQMTSGNVSLGAWSTLLGVAMPIRQPFQGWMGFTLENVFRQDPLPVGLELPPRFALGIGILPSNSWLWTHLIEYTRQEGQSLQYRTGVAYLMENKWTLSAGAAKEGVTLGFSLPLGFGKFSDFTHFSISVLMPYDIKQELRYSWAYTLGGK